MKMNVIYISAFQHITSRNGPSMSNDQHVTNQTNWNAKTTSYVKQKLLNIWKHKVNLSVPHTDKRISIRGSRSAQGNILSWLSKKLKDCGSGSVNCDNLMAVWARHLLRKRVFQSHIPTNHNQGQLNL